MLTFQGSWKNEYEAKGNEVALLGLEASVCSIMPNSLQHHGLWPAMLLCPWDSLGKNTGVGCCALLQGIFPTLGVNLHLLSLLH